MDRIRDDREIRQQVRAIGGRQAAHFAHALDARLEQGERAAEIHGSLVGRRPEAIVRYASDDPFEPARWWRNTADALSVSREWFGLLNAWAGFPVTSERW